jgi:plastocyanin domain-containing protein
MRRLPALAALVLLAGCAGSGPKEIQVTVTENGFEPANVVIARGEPAVIVFTRKTERTCATEALFAETGKKVDLPLDTPVRVDLSNVSPGTLHYACAMNMIKGTVTLQ